MALFREYFLIVAGGLVGAALGAAFGGLVGLAFPDLVALLWRPEPIGPAVPLAAGMGMVAGLPLGATAMAAGRVVGAVRHWAGVRDARPAAPADPDRG